MTLDILAVKDLSLETISRVVTAMGYRLNVGITPTNGHAAMVALPPNATTTVQPCVYSKRGGVGNPAKTCGQAAVWRLPTKRDGKPILNHYCGKHRPERGKAERI